MFDYKSFLANLTSRPGVYCMRDTKGNTLYVGKAKNLKNRVSSYFRAQEDLRISSLVQQIHDIEVMITANEKEALLLENTLIKSLKPRYNVIFKDDKSYPYLFISKHSFPRLIYHRGAQKEEGQYFGPYPSAQAVKDALNLLQKLFKIRQCDDTFFKNRSRPCLQYQIKRCTAPCVGYITEEDYQQDVNFAMLFLKGKASQILEDLTQKMQRASDNKAFETAAKLRDQIVGLRNLTEQQNVIGKKQDVDVVSIYTENHQCCVYLLFIRDGKMMGGKSFFPKISKVLQDEEILRSFINQYYLGASARDFPKEIVLNREIEDSTLITSALHDLTNYDIVVTHDVRSAKARWLQMALDNAKNALRQRLGAKSLITKRYEALQQVLGMSNISRMECFDISHTLGEATVASCVVFDENGPLKADYRLFNLAVNTGDDYAALEEAITRRYTRLKESDKNLPDILFIDGGKGQLNIGRRVLKECGVLDVILIGVAKGEGRKPGLETLFVCKQNGDESIKIITLDPLSPALHLIQAIRDEAHRFAILRHRKKRAKSRSQSPLEGIKGLGPKRRQALLTFFGGLQALDSASVETIAQVPGISPDLAQKIYAHLHGE